MSSELFNLEQSEIASSFLNKKNEGADGLLRPKLTETKEDTRELVLRILPNFTKEKKLAPTVVESHNHYADFKNNPKLRGYYDCQKDLQKSCDMCDIYWALDGDKNPEISDRKQYIKRKQQYYAYVYVVEDSQVPENEGRIFILPFGYQIYNKIKAAKERKRNPIEVADLLKGANLVYVIENNQFNLPDYNNSYFEQPSVIDIEGIDIELTKSGSPTKETQQEIIDFLLDRDFDIEDFVSKEWNEQQRNNVNEIIATLTNQEFSPESGGKYVESETIDSSAIFDDDDDDGEVVVEKPVRKTKKKVTVEEVEEDEEVVVEKPVRKTKNKVAIEEEVEEDELDATRNKVSKFFDED